MLQDSHRPGASAANWGLLTIIAATNPRIRTLPACLGWGQDLPLLTCVRYMLYVFVHI